MLDSEPARSEPIPIHVKWYETTMFFDERKGVQYLRSSLAPVVVVRNGGISSYLEDTWENWKISWDIGTSFARSGYSFGLNGRVNLPSPLCIRVPILDIKGLYLPNGATFDLARRLRNKVSLLLQFVKLKSILVPNGTLFLLTRPDVQGALDRNEFRNFVVGYSGVEPYPDGNHTLILNPPELWLPKTVKQVRPPDPVRLSRYTRPWLI